MLQSSLDAHRKAVRLSIDMTRIIGGLVGSRKLVSPAKATRPTSDRIRESIFSALEAKYLVEDKNVLDLYAGTGALGLEALSRGAKTALLVESNKMAAAVCIQNAKSIQKALDTEGELVEAKVQIQPVQAFLDSTKLKFDLVFMDPPYEVSNDEVLKNLTSLKPLLEKEPIILVERSSRAEKIEPEDYEVTDEKNYGDTVVYWLKPKN